MIRLFSKFGILSILIISLFFVSGCKEKFCGYSTLESCNSNQNCVTGGCSGDICQSNSTEPQATGCEWKECYDDIKYNVKCGCVNNKCQWS